MVDSKMNQLAEYSTTKLAYDKNYPIACTIIYEEDGRTVKHIDFPKLPTQTELQRWLREFKNIHVFPNTSGGEYYSYHLTYVNTGNVPDDYNSEWYKSYEEAIEEGLKEALKLI
jgi:hypothetical protein